MKKQTALVLIFSLLFSSAPIFGRVTPFNDGIEELLMTYQQYNRLNIAGPAHNFVIEDQGKCLYFCGVEHSYDPKHSQVASIVKNFEEFVTNTPDLKKAIVLVEGGISSMSKSIGEAVTNYGENGLTTFLARKYKIDIDTPDGDSKRERLIIEQLLKEYSAEEIAYAHFAQIATQWHRNKNHFPPFEDYVTRFLESYQRLFAFPEFKQLKFTFKEMKGLHKKFIGKSFNINDADLFRRITTPSRDDSVINAIVRRKIILRDCVIVNEICKYWNEGRSIFIVYGFTHAVVQEAALKKLLSSNLRFISSAVRPPQQKRRYAAQVSPQKPNRQRR